MPVKRVSFADLLKPDLLQLFFEEPYEIVGLEERARDMGWIRREEMKWALIGPVSCVRETDRALLVRITGDPRSSEVWVPKSMLHKDENEIECAGDQGMLVIPEWLAREKGWL